MSRRDQTTKEREGERAAKRLEQRVAQAKAGLVTLSEATNCLGRFPLMGKVLEQMRAHMEWLVAESEPYAQAAAELYVQARGDERNGCAEDHDRD